MENNLIEITHQTNKPILTTHRLISLNQNLPFCCIVSESTVAYIAGCSFIIENIRTLQQEILWVGQNYHEIVKVEKKMSNYGPMKIVMLLRNQYEMLMEIVMFVIDWNNYFYRKRNQKTVKIPEMSLDARNSIIKFDSSGEYVCLFSQEYNNKFFTTFPTNNSTLYTSKTRLDNNPTFIQSFKVKNQSYYFLVYEKEIHILTKRGEFKTKNSDIYQCEKNGLLLGEKILQIQLLQSCVGQILGFVLGSLGNMVIFRLNQERFQGFFRIDLRVVKQSLKVINHEHQGVQHAYKPNYSPQQLLLPTSFNVTNNRILLGYPNIRKLVYLTFSLLNHTNYSIHYTQNLIYLPSQKVQDEYTNSLAYHKYETEIRIQSISLSYDLCTAGLMIISQGYRYIHVLDMLNLLVPSDRFVENGGMRLFGNFGCKGICKSVAYLERQSQLLILFQNNKGQSYLSYYIFPYSPEISHKPPTQIMKWSSLLKNKAQLISAHPLNKTILILYYQLVRIHYYTHEKLCQNYININIPNCQCGSFSPYGDKIVLCNSLGIYVMDAYTMQMRNFVTGWAGVIGKLPTGLTFISDFDLVVQYGLGVNTYLLQLCDYKKIKMIGQLNTSITKESELIDKNIITIYNKVYSPNPNLCQTCQQTLLIDPQRQIIIYIIPGHQLKFYNINLQILNVISIQPTCVTLDREMEALFVGNSKGELYIFRWPDIVDKVSNIREFDPEVITVVRVHQDKIVSITVSLNLRYIIVVSESGEIGFLEFLQQNSPNITRQGALSMLKKSTLKPSLQTCLTSGSDENKRTQTIIKAVGKQVEVNKKNQKICEQLREHWEEKLKELNLKTLLMIKDEIDCSAEQIKIRNLLRQIDRMKVEIIEIKQRRQSDLKYQKQNSIQILTKQYLEGAELQKIVNNKYLDFKSQKLKLKRQLQKQYQSELAAQQIQYDIIIQDTKSHKKMQAKMQSYNERELLKFEQQRLEELNVIDYQFQQELAELCQRRNYLQNSIRKYEVYIKQYNQKNMFTGMQIMELKNDIEVISQTKPDRGLNKLEVAEKLKQVKIRNQNLIIQHRQQQQIKQKSSKKADHVEIIHNQLLKDIRRLQSSYEDIKNKKLQLDDSFYDENRRKIELNKSIVEMQARVVELKQKRDKIKQNLVINCNKISRSMHTEGHSPTKRVCQDNSPSNNVFRKTKIGSSLHKTRMNWKKPHKHQPQYTQLMTQQNIHVRDSINEKLEKLNNVKNERVKRYNLISKKLIMDHKRLTSQYNELKRYNDQLVKKQEKLILQIRYGTLQIPTKENKLKKMVKDIENKQNNTTANSRVGSSHSISKNPIFCKGKTLSKLKRSGFVSLYQNASLNFDGDEFDEVDNIIQ